VGERWLLLHVLDDAVRFDGWCAVREADVGRVDLMDPDDEFEPRALELRGDRPRRQPDVALGDVRALLASVQAISPLILLQTEADDPDIAYIGRIAAIDDGEIVLETVDRAGRWDDAERYRYADITRVEFGSGYLEALALVAGA
jgi:hypothetical protein